MAQGQVKGLQKTKGQAARHSAKAAATAKKGRRNIAPKKLAAVKSAALHRELSAKINKSVEQQVAAAASSGKLTIMRHVAAEGNAEKDKTKAKAKGKRAI